MLLKTEFVEEDHNWYLRAYIDLTEAEREKRAEKERLRREKEAAEFGEDGPGAKERTEASDDEAQAGRTAEAETGAGGKAEERFGSAETEASADEEADSAELPSVSIDDCVKVSRRLSQWLDKEDFIKEVYTLEVCSKGFL